MDRKNIIIKVLIVFFGVLSAGVAGLMIIEGWPFLDALYMSVITVYTVGYSEPRPLTAAGQIFIIIYIISGVGAFLYAISGTAEFIIAGHLGGVLGRKTMKRKINELNGHYIICGFGRVGQQVAVELKRDMVEFVVIDNDAEAIRRCAEQGFLYVQGSASEDEALKAAGIMRAKGLVSAIDSDAENVYVTLSAKTLRPDLCVVARASSIEAEHKLLKAHADRVLSPYTLGGRRLANLLLRPNVVEFLDVAMHGGDGDERLLMEEIEVREMSPFSGLTIGEAKQRCTRGANILAIKQDGNLKVVTDPQSRVTIRNGDLLIALGTSEQLAELEKMT